MLSSFGSLNTALRALQAMQQSIQVISHNVANAATPGYSRQKTILAPGTPYSLPATNQYLPFGQVGTGVVIQGVQRFRSNFLDSQIRNEKVTQQGWEVRQGVLQQLEVIFNEPSDTGFNSRLNTFWAAWQTLATSPDSAAARALVAETTLELAAVMRDTDRQFGDLQADLDDRVALQVDQINNLARRIADLNKTIREVQGTGQQPNDLRDQRDQLLTELAGVVDVEAYETDSGSMMVSLGGNLLVMDHVVSEIAVEQDPTNGMLNRLVWADSGAVVQLAGIPLEGGLTAQAADRLSGELGGALVARDLILPEKMAQLDDIAAALIENVNALHQTGFGLSGSAGGGVGGTTTVPGTVDGFSTTAPWSGLTSLPDGTYYVEIRDNNNSLEFRLVDSTGNPVDIDDATQPGTTTTNAWQSLDLVDGTSFDTGRGLVIDFSVISDHSLSSANTNVNVGSFSLSGVNQGTAELPSDTYYTEVRDNGGVWEFRLVDSAGSPAQIYDAVANDGSLTDNWQAIPGTPFSFDTGRGMTIQFTAGPYVEAVQGGSPTPPPIPAANVAYTARGTQVGTMDNGAASVSIGSFFTGTSARDIDLSDYIKEDYNRIAAAAAADSPGDGSVALAIAQLESAAVLNSDTTTIGDYYKSVITALGQETQQAEVMSANQALLVEHLETRQEAVAGVSIDEESVNMLQYQRTYQAAARVMTTVDEMLDRVINGMGLVGRR